MPYEEKDTGYETPCWLWTGTLHSEGYAVRGKTYLHRERYEAEVGQIPKGYTVDHLCRQRNCIRTSHMEPVTRGENCRRGARAKLDWEKVAMIRARCASGESQRIIAADFGVASSIVSRVKNERCWTR